MLCRLVSAPDIAAHAAACNALAVADSVGATFMPGLIFAAGVAACAVFATIVSRYI